MKSIINRSKSCLMALLTGVLVVSCNSDFLDRPTMGSMDESTFLKTEDAGYKLLVNCYQPMLDIWTFEQMWFDLGDQITDDCSKGGSDAADRVTITELTRGNPPTTNSMLTDLWNHRYKVAISNCNVFLANVTPETELIASGGSFVSAATKERWIAEAKFMRAFYYFDLASVFANIPIIDKPLGAEDKSAITKADKADVQKFILSDLDAAINGNQLPKAQNLSADELGRITHEAALSFRARVKIFFGD